MLEEINPPLVELMGKLTYICNGIKYIEKYPITSNGKRQYVQANESDLFFPTLRKRVRK